MPVRKRRTCVVLRGVLGRGNWLSIKQAQSLPNAPDITTTKRLRARATSPRFASSALMALGGKMGALRADSRRWRRAPDGTRTRWSLDGERRPLHRRSARPRRAAMDHDSRSTAGAPGCFRIKDNALLVSE